MVVEEGDVVREGGGQVGVQQDCRLQGPAAGHVPHGVSAPSQHHQGQPELSHCGDTVGVASQAETQSLTPSLLTPSFLPEVEAAQSVLGEAVGPALEDNAGRLVVLDYTLQGWPKYRPVAVVIHTFP